MKKAEFLAVLKDCLNEETKLLVKLAVPSYFNLLYRMWIHQPQIKTS